MRLLLSLLLSATLAHAASAPLPAKTREALDRLDARMSTINFSIRQNTTKLAKLKTDATLLQEKVNLAKDPNNRSRLEIAFANTDQKRRDCEAEIARQQKIVNDLLTARRLAIAAPPPSESVAQRNATLGIAKPIHVPVELPARASSSSPAETVDDDVSDGDENLPYVPHHKRK